MERRIYRKKYFFFFLGYFIIIHALARVLLHRVLFIPLLFSIYENDDGSIAGNTSARLFEEKLFRYELNVILTN